MKYLWLLPLFIISFVLWHTYEPPKGDLVSKSDAQVKVLLKVPSNYPTITVIEEETNTLVDIRLSSDIYEFITEGDKLNVTKEIYRNSKTKELNAYYTLISLDAEGNPIYDIDNAKDVITSNATIIILNKDHKTHVTNSGKSSSHYTVYKVTFKPSKGGATVTQSIPFEEYDRLNIGDEVIVTTKIFVLKNEKRITKFYFD